MNKQEYYVAMLINGQEVPSSAVANGTLAKCEATVKRMMATSRKTRHESISYGVFPCVAWNAKKEAQ